MFVQDEEYQFKLKRLLQKIQRFTKDNPESSSKLYNSINDIYNNEISNQANQVTRSNASHQEPKIKNPLVIKTRGRPAKKRIKSSFEKEKFAKKRTKNEKKVSKKRRLE